MDLLIIIAILIAYNVFINKVLEEKWHLIFSVALSAGLIWWVVHFSDLSLESIGAGLESLIPGLLWGLGSLIVIWLFIGITSLVPAAESFFSDERAINLKTRQLLYKTLVNIPVGTVLMEEVVFRGVILALLMQDFSTIVAVLISSLLFGLWHILPAVTNITTNKKIQGLKNPAFPVVLGTVVVTFFAGVTFSWLRIVSGSLLAPMFAHYATNSGGIITAWWLHNFKRKQ